MMTNRTFGAFHKKTEHKPLFLWKPLFIIFLCVAADQWTKYLAVRFLKPRAASFPLISGVFELTYLENKGAAWGMLQDARWIFLIVTAVCLFFLWKIYRRLPLTRRFHLLRLLIAVLMGGAVGNAADRMIHGYVIDFFWFSLINFPVFNLADCFITCSIALALILYRKEVLAWLRE